MTYRCRWCGNVTGSYSDIDEHMRKFHGERDGYEWAIEEIFEKRITKDKHLTPPQRDRILRVKRSAERANWSCDCKPDLNDVANGLFQTVVKYLTGQIREQTFLRTLPFYRDEWKKAAKR